MASSRSLHRSQRALRVSLEHMLFLIGCATIVGCMSRRTPLVPQIRQHGELTKSRPLNLFQCVTEASPIRRQQARLGPLHRDSFALSPRWHARDAHAEGMRPPFVTLFLPDSFA